MVEYTEQTQFVRQAPYIEDYQKRLLELSQGLGETRQSLPTQQIEGLSQLQKDAVQTGRGIGAYQGGIDTAYGTTGPSPGRWFAGGGGSGYYNPTTPTGIGEGGAGGGGSGLQGPDANDAPNCAANTGGGGAGAASFNALGGTGGSGIVILRYKINASQL